MRGAASFQAVLNVAQSPSDALYLMLRQEVGDASAEQRAKYLQYAEKRTPRTATPQGPARMMFAVDLVGKSAEIAERLYAQAAFREIDEVAQRTERRATR